MRFAPGLLALLLLLAAPAAARAQAAPICDEDSAGVVACLAGTLCRCRFERVSTMTGVPDGWRWDCGLLRPACPSAGAPLDPTINPYWGPLPGAVGIDRSRTYNDQRTIIREGPVMGPKPRY